MRGAAPQRFTTPDAYMFNLGSVASYLGRLARLLGRRADARRHLTFATKRNAELGLWPRAVEAELELSDLLAGFDRTAALACAGRVERAARDLGMQGAADRAARLLAALRS